MLFSINLSQSRRGKSLKVSSRVNNITKVVTEETKLLISSRCQGISVKVFDKSNKLINQFPTIYSTALHMGVNPKTISNIYKTGKSHDEFIYKFEVKDTRVWVYDSNNKVFKILDSIKNTSILSNIPDSTIGDYIKSGKLYKNSFYFRVIKDSNCMANSSHND